MLLSLQIENYALIRSLQIKFDRGFTVITGETGAGKSILIGAISLILGNRADTSILYDKRKKCFVEAVFDVRELQLHSFFEAQDLDYQEDTIIRREINENGKSRAFINDTPVTLPILRELTAKLIDIHSQHHNLLLNNAQFRLNVIDEYAKNQPLLADYRDLFTRYKAVSRQYDELVAAQAKAAAEQNYLSYIVTELTDAQLVSDEQTQLEQDITFLTHAEQIKTTLFRASQQLSEEENNIVQQLHSIAHDCAGIVSYNADIQDFSNRLQSALIELKDLSSDMTRLCDRVEVNFEALEKLQARLDFIYQLEQKHHVQSVSELLQILADSQAQLGQFTDNEAAVERLAAERAALLEKTTEMAELLSQRRAAVIGTLGADITKKLALLGMPAAQFDIRMERLPQFSDFGIDKATFFFSANQGGALQEIEKVASGGEISRVMLAVKSIVSAHAFLPTVIFDEIDTGISGDIAAKTAAVMADIAAQRQLLVITHLPQIAATGTLHYFVYKTVENGQTFTKIRPLTTEERAQEIAKMISGEQVSAAAIETAKELLTQK